MLVETEIFSKKISIDKNSIHAIILLVENSSFCGLDKPYYEKICGKEMNEYLQNICFGFKKSLVVLEEKANVFDVIKPYLDEKEITIVLYSNTPLLRRETIEVYVDRLVNSNDKIVQMPKGFVAKTIALKEENLPYFSPLNSFAKNEFFEVNNLRDLEQAERLMQGLILDFHMNNGVKIFDRTSTKIDADVDIEKGVVIRPFSEILGKTTIKKGAEIASSIIKNCKIFENAKIENCNLNFCEVQKDATVKPFTFAVKKQIKGDKKC